MRVVAQNVEHYLLARDLVDLPTPGRRSEQKISASPDYPSIEGEGPGIRDSLWLFDGHYLRAWTDVQTLLESAPAEYGRDLPPSTSSPVDFYPLSVLLHKGILFGLESELSQGRDADLSYFRSVSRVSSSSRFPIFAIVFSFYCGINWSKVNFFCCRRLSSYLMFFAIFSRSMTLQVLCISPINTKIYPTFHMLSKFSYIKF